MEWTTYVATSSCSMYCILLVKVIVSFQISCCDSYFCQTIKINLATSAKLSWGNYLVQIVTLVDYSGSINYGIVTFDY